MSEAHDARYPGRDEVQHRTHVGRLQRLDVIEQPGAGQSLSEVFQRDTDSVVEVLEPVARWEERHSPRPIAANGHSAVLA